ncbi:MAG: hypothetical protein LBP51_02685 [Deferribacteraceae bacterium]|nr:hypothetical protein [Deferribacteraceae bacterium]
MKGSGLPALEDVKEYRHIDISSRQRWTRGTVVDVVVTGGNHTPYNNEIRQNLNVSVVVVTEAPRSADERNKRLYPVLQGILHLLSGEDLELDIAPLIPGAFRDISFDDLTSIGAIAWQIDFTTDYTLETVSKEDAEEMIELGVSYSFGGSDTIRESSDIYKVKDIYTVEDLYV